MSWEFVVAVIVAIGGAGGISQLVKMWTERRKPRQDALQIAVSTSTELMGILPEIVAVLQSEVARQGSKILLLEERSDITEKEVESLERFAGEAVAWMDGAHGKLIEYEIEFAPPPKWKKDSHG